MDYHLGDQISKDSLPADDDANSLDENDISNLESALLALQTEENNQGQVVKFL